MRRPSQGRGWVATRQGGAGWCLEPSPIGLPALPVLAAHATAALGQPAPVLAASYGWCEAMHAVSLPEALMEQGLSHQAACAYLDAAPNLHFQAWWAPHSRALCLGLSDAQPLVRRSCMACAVRLPESRVLLRPKLTRRYAPQVWEPL